MQKSKFFADPTVGRTMPQRKHGQQQQQQQEKEQEQEQRRPGHRDRMAARTAARTATTMARTTRTTTTGGRSLTTLLRDLHGVFAIYKKCGKTSADYLNQLRESISRDAGYDISKETLKIGHGGTLDLQAEGVLAVGLGRGCQLLPALLKGNKKYVAVGKLGITTDTYNAEGKVMEVLPYDHVTKERLDKALCKYRGPIMQTPPKYSALKVGGRVRMSDLARAGKDVFPEPRPVVTHRLVCTEFSPPLFKIEVTSGRGFYVRSLVHDLGKELGTCAHVVSLLRAKHGPFEIADALTEDNWTLPAIKEAIHSSSFEIYFKKWKRKQKSWW